MKRFKAAILGGSGYGAAEMIRRLLIHPEVELVRVGSIDYIDQPLADAHPHLEGLTDLKFQNLSPAEAAKDVDVVLLGLPHKVSAAAVPPILEAGAKVVDLSGDYRLKDVASYESAYGGKHPHPELLSAAVYGLPETNRDAIRKAKLVASPGCFATSIQLGLIPLAKKGLLQGAVEVVGITGSSGSGVAPQAGTHHPVRSVNLRTYKPLKHQHVPEVLESLATCGAKDIKLHFVPVSAPLSRGIFTTSFVRVPASVTKDQIAASFAEAFGGEPFVRTPRGRLPEVVAVSGSNYAEVGFELGPVEDGSRTLACFTAIDNLIKGGAGQGIQNMNLVLGLDEGITLRDPGNFP